MQGSIMENWIPWAIVVASLFHIAEEYFGGWLKWVQRYAKGVTIHQFVFVNCIFVALCITASISTLLLFKLTISSLIFVNAIVHIFPTIAFKHYSPGIWTASFLYIPLSFSAYFSAAKNGSLTLSQGILACIIAIVLMLIPILAQFIRIRLLRTK